jgi:hypothetical protein
MEDKMNRRQMLYAGAGLAITAVAGGKRSRAALMSRDVGGLSIVGSWKLISIATVRPNGQEVTDWAGPKPTGLLMYAADGFMSVHIVRDPPARWDYSAPEQATVAERAHAFDRYYGYYGKYALDAGRGVVTHFVEASLQPNEVGVRYERQFRLQGERLNLTATPFTFKGERRFNKLVWERVKAT